MLIADEESLDKEIFQLAEPEASVMSMSQQDNKMATQTLILDQTF